MTRARLQTVRIEAAGVRAIVFVLPAPTGLGPLTVTEREVAVLALRGLSNAEIAKRRRVAVRTVANQLAAVFLKTGTSSRAELAAMAGLHTSDRGSSGTK